MENLNAEKVLMAPGFIAIAVGMLLLSVADFFVFDLLWLLTDFIEDKAEKREYSLKRAINYLLW